MINMTSVQTKRRKYDDDRTNKRSTNTLDTPKRDDFIIAMKKESQSKFFNYVERLKLLYVPQCNTCSSSTKINVTPTLQQIENIVNEDVKVYLLHEALETAFLSVTKTQFLSANMLKTIVEIILNTHGDCVANCEVNQVIKRCQMLLSYNFTTHPPCHKHDAIINCYKEFLTGSMNAQTSKYSNREKFSHVNGVVKYCFNRLEDEIQHKSLDGPLFSDKLQENGEVFTINQLYSKQQNFAIFEMLKRPERIDRIMAVLHSVIQLIQFDSLLCYSSKSNISQKLLLSRLCGTIKQGLQCPLSEQIMTLFTYFIHLGYPEEHIHTMTLWLNTVVEYFYYISKKYDYPIPNDVDRYFAVVFYEIITKLPHESIVKILERIEPAYMRYMVSLRYCEARHKLPKQVYIGSICDFVTNLIKNRHKDFLNEDIIVIPKNLYKDVASNDILKSLSNICNDIYSEPYEIQNYPKTKLEKRTNASIKPVKNKNDIHILYITLNALLNIFNIRKIHETLPHVNKYQDDENEESTHATEVFESDCRSIYFLQMSLNEVLEELRDKDDLPKCFECFYI